MAQGNMEFVAKIDDLLGFEDNIVVNDNLFGAAKSGKDIALKELDNGGFIGLSAWDVFNPLSEIISGC